MFLFIHYKFTEWKRSFGLLFCRTFLSSVFYVLNLRDDALPSACSLLRSVRFLSVSWPPFLSVITFPKLSYKTFQIVL